VCVCERERVCVEEREIGRQLKQEGVDEYMCV